MKATLILRISLGCILGATSLGVAQAQSASKLTRKVVPQREQPQAPPARTAPQRAAPQTPQGTTARPAATADPQKARAAQEEARKKTIEFEKKRAEEGWGWAQHSLGLRYLNGDGVEKDAEAARKWLKAAAENGEAKAAKALEEMGKNSPGSK